MKRFFYVFVLLFFFQIIKPIVKGSETQVSIESFITFPQADSDNAMIGFGWFKNGFGLENSSTRVDFNSTYPVAGTVDLKGGTVNLLQDLVFKNNTDLVSMGTILAHGYVVDFSPDIDSLPAPASTFEDAKIFFNSDITFNTIVTFKGNCIVNGGGNSIYLGPQGSIVVDTDSIVVFRNVEIQGLKESNVSCTDDTGEIHFDNSRAVFSDDFMFSKGSFKSIDQVDFVGRHVFTYDSNIPSVIDLNSTWNLIDGLNFTVLRQNGSNRISPLIFTDHSSTIRFDNAFFTINDPGMRLTRGTILFDREVTIAITSTDYDSGIYIGDGTSEGDCYLQFNAGAILRLPQGHATFDNISPQVIRASAGTSSKLIRSENSYMQLLNDVTFPNLGIALTSNMVPPIIIAPGKTIEYSESFISIPSGEFDVTSSQNSIFTYTLDGNDRIFFRRGILPLGLIVSGTGNTIEGNGSITGPIFLASNSSASTFGIDGLTQSSITLNGGTIDLSAHLNLARNAQLIGPGKVNVGSFYVAFPPSATTWSNEVTWNGVMGALQLNSSVDLESTWNIQGNIIINGQNNKLDLFPGGQIIVEPNSTLTLKSIKLTGISGTNIICADNSAKIILEDVEWYQSGDFNYENGSLEAHGDIYMIGLGTAFNFRTSQVFAVTKNAVVRLDEGFIFNYDPQSTTSAHLIQFADRSATLSLMGATLQANSNGLSLIDGTIWVKRNSYLKSAVVSEADAGAIVLGDGNPDHDPHIIIYNSITLKLLSGTCNIRTVKPDSFIFSNFSSELSIAGSARLNVYNSIMLDPGLLTLQNSCLFGVNNSSGAEFVGNINIPGDYTYISM